MKTQNSELASRFINGLVNDVPLNPIEARLAAQHFDKAIAPLVDALFGLVSAEGQTLSGKALEKALAAIETARLQPMVTR